MRPHDSSVPRSLKVTLVPSTLTPYQRRVFVVLILAIAVGLIAFARDAVSAQANKSLIKLANDPTVYWLQNNRIYGVYASSLQTMRDNNMPGWWQVNTVPSLAGYSRGPDFISTGPASHELLIKLTTDPTVYVVHDGYREPLSSTAFNQRGYSLNDVIDVPPAILNMFQRATDAMQYLGQSPADDTVFAPNTFFTMNWQLKNTGGTRWFNYDAVWVQQPSSGSPSENMTSPLRLSAPAPYAGPNETVTLSVQMISPPSPGTHWMYMQLRSLDGNNFGVQFFIRIVVSPPSDGMEVVNKTPADGTVVGTNAPFTATWQLQNTGGTTWNNSYSAVWIQNPVNGHESTNLTSPLRVGSDVPSASPGQIVNLTVMMIAPPDPGIYYMYWQLQNGSGNAFGPIFYVQIVAGQAGNESFGSDGEDFGSGDSPGSNVGMSDDSLNTATGNFNYRVTDLSVPGRGLDFVFGRSYNAQDPTGGPMGAGWSHSFNIYLAQSPDADIVTLHYGDGKVLTYVRAGTNLYKPRSAGYYDTLSKNMDGTWVLLKSDQREFHLNNQGRLSHIRDHNGNQITLYYGADNNLARVVDTVGREFFFTYTNSLLTGLRDPLNRRLTFEYTGGRLAAFRDAKNNANTYSYDGAGRLSELFDGRGLRVMANAYDGQGRLVTQTNGRNFQWTITYNAAAGTTTVADPNQRQIVYSYDSGHKLVGFTNRLSQQNKVAISYDDKRNRSGVNDPNSLQSVHGYLYDERNGYVTRSTDPDQKTRTFVYDVRNNPTQTTNELNQTTVMGYDARGNLTTLTDALRNATSVSYDAFGEPVSITDPELNTTSLSYDAHGNLVRVVDAMNNVTQYEYDGAGRRVSATDARNKITRFTYDDNDNLTSVQRPVGTTMYAYDQADNLISITDPALNLTTYEYDANGNLVVERDATRLFFTRHTYDALDRLTATLDRRGNTTSFEYDPEGRLLAVIDPMLNRTSYTYDGNGNRLSVTDANNQTTTFTYDNLNRLKTVADPLGNMTRRDYDAAGRLISETDARGNTTRYTYDEVGNLTQVDDAEAGVSRYTYDKNRNLRTQTDPNNRTSSLTYDKDERLVFTVDPLGNRYDYEYDAVGNRVSQTDAKRQTIRFTYDDNSRLASISYPDGAAVQLAYDVNGNLRQVSSPLGTTTYAYDALNRITSYTDVYGKTIGYQYDPNGNVSTLTYPDGKQVQYAYDKNNRMTSLTDWGGMTVSYEYNSINLLTRITPPSSSENGATIYSYDLAGRLTGMTNFRTRGSNNSYSYTLDRNGNRTSANVQEPLPNRVAVTTQGYGYDLANRIQNAGATTFTFDANGNMTSKTENGVTTAYAYDFDDRLTSAGVNAFTYNAQGVRVAKSQAGAVTRYVVDVNRELSQVLCETDGGGAITSYYVYGQGLVYKVLPNGAHYYYQFDPNGSTISMTTFLDFSVNRYAYDSYGKVTNSAEVFPNTNTTVPNPFIFGGRFGLMDDGNGLVYVRARYYSPDLGRFLTKDPLTGDLKDGQSLNRYIYASGNPVRFIDVNGLFSLSNAWSDVKDFLTGTGLGIGKDVLKWGYKGGSIAYSKHRQWDYTKGGIIGGLKSGITPQSVAVNLASAGASVVTNKVADWALNKIEGPRKNVKVNIPGYGDYDLSQGLPIVSKVPVFNALNLAAGKALFRYGVAGDNADENGDLYENGKKVGNLSDYGITGPAKATAKPKTKAVTKSSTVLPRGAAIKVMPRGPAATPVMPRGPKPAPIAPRGPAPKKR